MFEWLAGRKLQQAVATRHLKNITQVQVLTAPYRYLPYRTCMLKVPVRLVPYIPAPRALKLTTGDLEEGRDREGER